MLASTMLDEATACLAAYFSAGPVPRGDNLLLNAPAMPKLDDYDWARPRGLSSDQDWTSRAVIQVSNDEHLARSRSLLLQSVGFRVHTYSNSQARRMLLSEQAFAIFLCQTIPVEKAVALSQAVRNLDTSVLLVRATHSPGAESVFFDRVLHAPVTPRKLTREMLELRANTHRNGEVL